MKRFKAKTPASAKAKRVETAVTAKIELHPHHTSGGYLSRGDREIFVDGEQWGFVWMRPNGMHGTRYTFMDTGGNHITAAKDECAYYHREYGTTEKFFAVEGDKQYARSHGIYGNWEIAKFSKENPLWERVEAAIIKLIADGRLVSPHTLEVRREQAARKMAEQEAALDRKHAVQRDQVAREVIKNFRAAAVNEMTDHDMIELHRLIVGALEKHCRTLA